MNLVCDWFDSVRVWIHDMLHWEASHIDSAILSGRVCNVDVDIVQWQTPTRPLCGHRLNRACTCNTTISQFSGQVSVAQCDTDGLKAFAQMIWYWKYYIYTVIPRYIMVHFSRLHCITFKKSFKKKYMYFYNMDFPLYHRMLRYINNFNFHYFRYFSDKLSIF